MQKVQRTVRLETSNYQQFVSSHTLLLQLSSKISSSKVWAMENKAKSNLGRLHSISRSVCNKVSASLTWRTLSSAPSMHKIE